MGTIGSSKRHSQDDIGVSHTLSSKASNDPSTEHKKRYDSSLLSRDDHCHRQNEGPRGPRTSTSVSKFPLINVSSSQKRRLCSAHFQPEGPQSIRHNDKIQISECFSCARLPTAKRLAVQNRSLASVLSRSSCSQPQKISTLSLSKRTIGNDMFTLWSKYRTQDFRISDELDCTNAQKTRNTDTGVSGRLSDCSSMPGKSKGTCKYCHPDSRDVRLDHKLREICVDSVKNIGVSRRSVECLDKSEATSQGEADVTDCQAVPNARQGIYNAQGGSESGWTSEFCEFYRTKGPTQLSSFIGPPQQNVEIRPEMASNSYPSQGQYNMVASELQTPFSHSCTSTNPLPNNRCLRYSMGSSIRQSVTDRVVGRSRKTATLQPERNARHPKGVTRSLSTPASEYSTNSVRQQNCYRISPTRRGHEIHTTDGSNISSFSDSGRIPNSREYFSHSRDVQRSCRPFVKTSGQSGMASLDQSHRESVCQMGDPPDRPLCLQSSTRRSELCIPGSEGSPSVISRCVLPTVGFSTGVDFPATLLDSQSAIPFEQCSRDILTSSSALGSSILAGRSEGPSVSSPIHTSESRPSLNRRVNGTPTSEDTGHDSRGMEMWGWADTLKDWNDDQIKLLKKSWRPSTLKTYGVAWKKWLIWSEQHQINPHDPSGREVARFLSDLHLVHNLSYNTILLHKSVISTLCNPDIAGQISSHILVKQVLKSIALEKPVKSKPPIWNIDSLAAYLNDYNFTRDNIFQVQRHTATLLLLCSGRRIHDLTLLRTDSEHCIQSNNSITLWPVFGSKTDSSDHRQSGWKLFSNLDSNNLDPVYWINRTIELLKIRRDLAKIHNLFISTRGEAKAASKTIISGWIRTLLKDACITATPGSFRSAVASKNWVDNFPLEDILARGNWKSQNTFCKFYKRTVLPSSSSTSITMLFNPVE